MLVSIVIPAYKKEKTIKKDLKRIDSAMSKTRWEYEIILVVDGMVDKTFEKASKIKNKKIKVLGLFTNKGKGYAIRYGMARAEGDIIAFIDSGMEINPNSISMVLEHMEWYDADIIVGSKRHLASKVNYPLVRKIYSWGYYTMVKLLFGVKVSDTQTGLKVFKREVLEKVLPRLLVKQYAIDIEILAVARRLGFKKIYEAPVELTQDFSSGTRFTRFLIMDPFLRKMLINTLAVFYRLKILKYYDDASKRKWIYDKELDMRINTGEFELK